MSTSRYVHEAVLMTPAVYAAAYPFKNTDGKYAVRTVSTVQHLSSGYVYDEDEIAEFSSFDAAQKFCATFTDFVSVRYL